VARLEHGHRQGGGQGLDLKQREPLLEAELNVLCLMAMEILVEESNVHRIEPRPIKVRVIPHLLPIRRNWPSALRWISAFGPFVRATYFSGALIGIGFHDLAEEDWKQNQVSADIFYFVFPSLYIINLLIPF
jgi:hypothetical protein